MNLGKLVFAQLMQHLLLTTFHRCVARYGGEHKVKVTGVIVHEDRRKASYLAAPAPARRN